MTIKQPHYGDLNLLDFNYLIIKDKVFICNKDFNRFELSNKGEKMELAKKYHVELLKLDRELKTVDYGLLLKPTKKKE